MEKELGQTSVIYQLPYKTKFVKNRTGMLLLGDGHSRDQSKRSVYEIVAELNHDKQLEKLTLRDPAHRILVKADQSCNPTESSAFYLADKNLVDSLMKIAREWLKANNVITGESHQEPASSKFSEINGAGLLIPSVRDGAPHGVDSGLLSHRFSKISSLERLGPKRGTSILKLTQEIVDALGLREGMCFELDLNSDPDSITFIPYEQQCWAESVFSDGIRLAIGVPHRQMGPNLHFRTKVGWMPVGKEDMLELRISPGEDCGHVRLLRRMSGLQCDYGVNFPNKIRDAYGIAEYMQCFWRKMEGIPKIAPVRSEKIFTTVRQMPSLYSKSKTYAVLPHRVAEKYPNYSVINFTTDEKGQLVAARQK